MLPEIPNDELAACLDRVASRLLRRAGVRSPPVDALRITAALGIQMAFDREQPVRARYVELRRARGGEPRPTILLRPEPRTERQQWAIAHELGEREAAFVFRRLSVDPAITAPATREAIANALAGRILLPTRWLRRIGTTCGWDLSVLKRRFATASNELIMRRMLDFPAPIVVTIFDHGALTFRRANLPGRLPHLPLERDCWRAAHETSRFCERTADNYTVRAWPAHEEGWKRELVRVDFVEGCEEWPSESI